MANGGILNMFPPSGTGWPAQLGNRISQNQGLLMGLGGGLMGPGTFGQNVSEGMLGAMRGMNYDRNVLLEDEQRKLAEQDRAWEIQDRERAEAERQRAASERAGIADWVTGKYPDVPIGMVPEVAKMMGKELFGGAPDRDKPPAGYRWTPDGQLSAIPGGPATTIPAEVAGRLAMMESAVGGIEDAYQRIKNASGTDYLTAQVGAGEMGQAQRQIRTAIEAALRAMTGAAAPDSEVAKYEDLFLPNSSDRPETVDQKKRLLLSFINNAQRIASQGRGGVPGASSGVAPGVAMPPLPPGFVLEQ